MNLVETDFWSVRSPSTDHVSFRSELVLDLINEREVVVNNKVLPYNSGTQCEFDVTGSTKYTLQLTVEYKLKKGNFQKAEIILYNRFGDDMCTNSIKIGVDSETEYVHFGWRGKESDREDRTPHIFPRSKPSIACQDDEYWGKTVDYSFEISEDLMSLYYENHRFEAEIINRSNETPQDKRMIEVVGYNQSDDDSQMIIKKCILMYDNIILQKQKIEEEEVKENVTKQEKKMIPPKNERRIKKIWRWSKGNIWHLLTTLVQWGLSFAKGVVAQVINHFLRDLLICLMWTFLVCFIITFIGAVAIYFFGSYFLCKKCDCQSQTIHDNNKMMEEL